MTIYKNIKSITVSCLSAMLLLGSACEVTDLTPATFIPEEEAFADAQRIEAAVIGVYEAAQLGYYGGTPQRGYPFGAATVEQGDMRGEDMYNDQLFYEITYTNAYSPTTANNEGMWYSLYRLINRTNIVLEGLEEAVTNEVLTQEEADVYRGEMLVLRAMSHHELLLHFCRPYVDDPSLPGVPYRTFAINDTEKVSAGEEVERGTIEQAYTQLLTDLDEAETLLPASGEVFRASQGAAIALKNRIKLHMGDWPGVVEEYNKLTSLYELSASPDEPFRSATASENIFFMENSEASNPGVNAALVNMYGDPALGGRGLVKISPIIWQEAFWLEGDLRRTLLTTSNPDSPGIYTYKYDAYGVFDDPTPLIRFTEMVLNTSEAYFRQGNFNEAVTLLNSVRDRSTPEGTPSYTAADLQTNGLIAIINERRIEFLAEGKRWGDIHRLSGEGFMDGIPSKAQSRSVSDFGQYTGEAQVVMDHSLSYDDDLFIWPIPLQEIQNNPTLAGAQNPGY